MLLKLSKHPPRRPSETSYNACRGVTKSLRAHAALEDLFARNICEVRQDVSTRSDKGAEARSSAMAGCKAGDASIVCLDAGLWMISTTRLGETLLVNSWWLAVKGSQYRDGGDDHIYRGTVETTLSTSSVRGQVLHTRAPEDMGFLAETCLLPTLLRESECRR